MGYLSKEMGLEIYVLEISTSHPLPSYGEAKEDKINKLYESQKLGAGCKASSLDALKEMDNVKDTRIYVLESLTSLTPFRKKLFGAVNKIKKKLQ